MEVVSKATQFTHRVAAHCKGRNFTYGDLLKHSSWVSQKLLGSRSDLNNERVVFITPQSYEYLPCQWGIWRAGGVAVPLCTQHPPPEWEYIIQNSEASAVVCHSSYYSSLQPLCKGVKLIPLEDFVPGEGSAQEVFVTSDLERPALMIYTSGTTGKPKGVVSTHRNLSSQVKALVEVWKWQEDDHILEVLPLHHVHGIMCVLACANFAGARVTFNSKFDQARVWEEFMEKDLNMFMAVPTIYNRLIDEWNNFGEDMQKKAYQACERFRLMVSGSMALPEPMLDKWHRVSGHTLLERYGMTECGMILSNPYKGKRKPGCVGFPLPEVEVKLDQGELCVKGPNVFKRYFNNPKATEEAFDQEGWFKTGDIAEVDSEGYFKLLGRASVDIIKTGGYKVSALDIEQTLLSHPSISEVNVVGVPDEDWGQVIGVVLKSNQTIKLEDLQEWSKQRLAVYKVPRKLIQLQEIPRNQMGKVNKKELVKLF